MGPVGKLVFIGGGLHVFISLMRKIQLNIIKRVSELSFFFIHIGPTMHLNIIIVDFAVFLASLSLI